MEQRVDIIFLNGTSSAGKTTVANALRRKLGGVWLHVTLDAVFNLMPRDYFKDPAWGDTLNWDSFLGGFHAMVAALPATGFPVILDHVCTSARWRDDCAKLFRTYRVLYVGVSCSIDELRRRESARGDRKTGIAEEHLATYRTAGPFDVEVDTSVSNPEECADQIIAAMSALTGPTAFEGLCARLAPEGGCDR